MIKLFSPLRLYASSVSSCHSPSKIYYARSTAGYALAEPWNRPRSTCFYAGSILSAHEAPWLISKKLSNSRNKTGHKCNLNNGITQNFPTRCHKCHSRSAGEVPKEDKLNQIILNIRCKSITSSVEYQTSVHIFKGVRKWVRCIPANRCGFRHDGCICKLAPRSVPSVRLLDHHSCRTFAWRDGSLWVCRHGLSSSALRPALLGQMAHSSPTPRRSTHPHQKRTRDQATTTRQKRGT